MTIQEIDIVDARIKHLLETELEALRGIDSMAVGSLERKIQWDLIRDLASRRHELQETIKQLNPPKS